MISEIMEFPVAKVTSNNSNPTFGLPISTQDNYFATLMSAAVDAIIVIDQHGRIEIFNNAAEWRY